MFIRNLVSSRHIVNKAWSLLSRTGTPPIKITQLHQAKEFNLEFNCEERAHVLQHSGITEDSHEENILGGGTVASAEY